MALLDTLKSGLKSAGNAVLGAVAPGAAAVKNTVTSGINAARSAASMAPTNDPNKLFSSTGGQKSLQNDTVFTVPQGGGIQTVTKSPTPTLQQTNPVTPKGDIGVPQIGSNSVALKAVNTPNPVAPAPAPKTTTPAVNTQVSGSNPFGNSNYTPTFSNPNPTPAPVTPVATKGPEVPTTGYVNAPAPTADALNGTTQNTQLSDLQKALLGTYNQTAEEKQAQDALVALAKQQADLSGAYRSGTNKIGEQPIVLDLLRGQQQALQKQYEGQVGAIADQAKPLEVQLANLLANREQQNKALSTQYGFITEEQKRQDAIKQAQASGNKPIEVGGSLLQLNPQTGKYEVIYSAPSDTANGFTLSEGQIRYDANGNPIARGGEKSTSATDKITMVNGMPYQYDNGVLVPINVPKGTDPAAAQKASSIKTIVNDLLNSPNLSSVVGPLSSKLPTLTGGSADFESKLNTLKSLLTLDNLGFLKGAMSDKDVELLSSAATSLNKGMSEEGFKNELRNILSKVESGASQSSGMQMDDNAKKSALLQGGVSQSLIDATLAGGHSLDDLAKLKGVTFTNASNSALNSSKTQAVISVKPNGSWGGQCGEFIHNIVKDYPYGLNGINQKEAIINVPKTQLPQVGDVVIQRVAGSTGHVAVVNHVDPTTGKITLTESNWNNNEKVSNNRTMSVNSPTISGYYRGSLAV